MQVNGHNALALHSVALLCDGCSQAGERGVRTPPSAEV